MHSGSRLSALCSGHLGFLLSVLGLLQQANQDSPRILGVPLVGITSETATKLLLTVGVVLALTLISWVVRSLVRLALRDARHERLHFWTRQAIRLLIATVFVIALLSIWFDDPGRLATVLGLVSAGVAIALRRVITSFAAYVIILRGRIFTVGDRITMGGVRGDVVELDFMQTTVMEMGQAPGEQRDDPSMWVRARQYTGRLVRVTNDRIFDTAVYNFTREFPYMWEEIQLPIPYTADRGRAEAILMEVADRHTRDAVAEARPAFHRLQGRYRALVPADVAPRVYQRLTDNWVEMSLRFITPVHGIRERKDAMSREILAALESAKISVASATFEIVGVPPLKLER
ncbi:MAG TPA: mechanosensitive ion channel domain-containing protein [Gemmatimonadaceae bacterium]|nr:mechanosensitive ion channel domain-containing protein [Gemmatimonadaceae bacterium]